METQKIIQKFILSLSILFLLSSIIFSFTLSSSSPPISGSYAKITVLDADTGLPIPSNISIRMEFAPPNSSNSYSLSAPLFPGQDLNLNFPPDNSDVTAHISASASGYYENTEEITVTSAQYWGNIGQATINTSAWGAKVKRVNFTGYSPPSTKNKGAYLTEHTFTLKKKPVPTVNPASTQTLPTNEQILADYKNQQGGVKNSFCPFLSIVLVIICFYIFRGQ